MEPETADDIISSPAVSINSKKRAAPVEDYSPSKKPLNIKGDQFIMPTPPDTDQSSNMSPTCQSPNDRKRSASPAASDSTLSMEVSSSDPACGAQEGSMLPETSGSTGPPAKRRKKTPSEKLEEQRLKEVKAREKEEKQAQKQEEKARKDEEKARKEEERAKKDGEKRAKAEEREAKKREKEHAEELKSQEKLKKERAQMRLGAFFQPKPGSTGNEGLSGIARRKSLSFEPFDAAADQVSASTSPTKGTPSRSHMPPAEITTPVVSDYQKAFLPFELPPHGTMLPLPSSEDYDLKQAIFGNKLDDPSLREKHDLRILPSYCGLEEYFPPGTSARRGREHRSVEELVGLIQGTFQQPIDLTRETTNESPMEQLRRVPVKHIHFYEDVRPAYLGTYSKINSPAIISKMRRNPLYRGRPDTNYDDDSEAEWEEPEEGDDICSDDEESDNEGDTEDIEGFLDDSEDTKVKRKAVATELVPECTGLCWADETGQFSSDPALRDMRIAFLPPRFTGVTIDPFSADYWTDDEATSAAAADVSAGSMSSGYFGLMVPPRQPLQPRPNSANLQERILVGAAEGEKGPITNVAASQAKRGPKPQSRILSSGDLAAFKDAVVGSNIGKLELQKQLKTRYVQSPFSAKFTMVLTLSPGSRI